MILFANWMLLFFTSCGSTKMLRHPHESESSIIFASGRGVSDMISSEGSNRSVAHSDGSNYGASLFASGINVFYNVIRRVFVHSKSSFLIELENIETHEQYVSCFFKSIGIHNNIVFYDIPAGTYKVKGVGFALKHKTGDEYRWEGNVPEQVDYYENHNYYSDSQDLSDFFGTIVIEPGRKYYLGTFCCYYEGDGDAPDIKLEYLDPYSFINTKDVYIPNEIRKAVSKSDWKEGDFIILHPANEEKVFDFKPVPIEKDE